jgi:hypothetical protein
LQLCKLEDRTHAGARTWPWKTLGIIAGRKFTKAANFFNLPNNFLAGE